MRTDEQKLMMMEYMEKHAKATAQELMNEMGRILKMTLKK